MTGRKQTPTEKTGAQEAPPHEGNSAPPSASWDLFYLTEEGFEAHLQLHGDGGEEFLERVKETTERILEQGGHPRPLRGSNRNERSGNNPEIDEATMTYMDEEGVRRCARLKKDGTRCGSKVGKLREGKYGDFYPCSNYREHEGK